VHIVASYLPLMQGLLRMEPLRLDEWAFPVLLALAVLVVAEADKWWLRRGAH
jgi:hypothetical protein